MVALQPVLAVPDRLSWRRPGRLREDLSDDDGIRIDAVDDAPCPSFVDHSEFVASRSDAWQSLRLSKMVAS